MKIPLLVSVLILASGAVLGWYDYQRLAVVRRTHAELVAEAAKFGITINALHAADAARIPRQERQAREVAAQFTAAEFMAFARDMEASDQANNGQPDAAMQQRIMNFMDRIMLLKPAELKSLIAEVAADKDLKDQTRQSLISFCIMSLANNHPQAALMFVYESSDLFKDGRVGEQAVAAALARWAKDDPMAALEWFSHNAEKYSTLITEDTKRGMIQGAALLYPKLAFQLIGELDFKEPVMAIQGIVGTAQTPADRTAMLAALRGHLATITDASARDQAAIIGVRMLVQSVVQDGFDSASKWLAAANLTPAELAHIANGLSYNSATSGETGQWIEWLSATLPRDDSRDPISNIVSNWTRTDYQSATNWLGSIPAGPARNISVRAYAETVASYDANVAAQWAMTLPDGTERDATLMAIHRNLAQKNPADAAAFATRYGIK
ncbi:MAG: hypothetical protein NTV46_12160 [Verrucomicrobia bacterium]|nr:hypothetical protein [Verrucomicrobiota bacterium]